MHKKLYLVGNAHLDPAWYWRWQEGYSEVKSTFAAALKRLEEYPDFVFTCSAAAYYKWLEEDEPDIFEKIKQYVKEGRWNIAGGWWVQSDCNMPGGETFARHSLYGQRYFKSRFGVIAKTGYNVDSFGHNANLPQILKKSGMANYTYRRPSQEEKAIKDSVFTWQSPDGSQVTAARLTYGYETRTVNILAERLKKTKEDAEELGIDLLCFYGVGNHGGGPTIDQLDYITGHIANGNSDNLKFANVDEYFDDIRNSGKELVIMSEDQQHHASGCYSAHSELKKKFRQAENNLIHAEKYAAFAGKDYKAKLDYLWETLLFNTFHDILCGCSIKAVCEDALHELGMVICESQKIANSAVQSISYKIDTLQNEKLVEAGRKLGQPVVVFNPHSWEAKIPVLLRTLPFRHNDEKIDGDEKIVALAVFDLQGNCLPMQHINGNLRGIMNTDGLFTATVPPMGYKLYYIKGVTAQMQEPSLTVRQLSDDVIPNTIRKVELGYIEMENEFLKVQIDRKTGGIIHLHDKEIGKEVFSSPAAIGLVIEDWENDTWAHGSFYFNEVVGKFNCDEIIIEENGPVRVAVKSKCSFGKSTLTQRFILYNDARSVQVETQIDWNEKHKMLKLVFPIQVENPFNTYQIPYSHIHKECTGEEQVAIGWFDITGENQDETYGVTVTSDCKYSFSAQQNEIRMTSVRSAAFADHGGIRNAKLDHDYLDMGTHSFTYSIWPHAGKVNPSFAEKRAAEQNTQYEIVNESYHEGWRKDKDSFAGVSCENIIIAAVKQAEEKDGYIIRAYEVDGRAVTCQINTCFFGKSISVDFAPYEIKTIYIHDDGTFQFTDFLEDCHD